MFPALSFSCATHDEGDNFSGIGSFNPRPGEAPFGIVEASDAIYEIAHGQPRPIYEDED
jgi:hypothetical protein